MTMASDEHGTKLRVRRMRAPLLPVAPDGAAAAAAGEEEEEPTADVLLSVTVPPRLVRRVAMLAACVAAVDFMWRRAVCEADQRWMESTTGVLFGLAACVMWLGMLIFVFFQARAPAVGHAGLRATHTSTHAHAHARTHARTQTIALARRSAGEPGAVCAGYGEHGVPPHARARARVPMPLSSVWTVLKFWPSDYYCASSQRPRTHVKTV